MFINLRMYIDVTDSPKINSLMEPNKLVNLIEKVIH